MLTTCFLTLMFTAFPAGADPGVREVSVYDGHVTLEIPAQWEEIPYEMLESHSLRLAEASGGLLTEIYQYGFRSSDPEADFVLPECLIQFRESGRLSYRRFLHLPTTEEMREAGKQRIEERAGPAVRRLELTEAVFDRETYSFHLSNTLVLTYPGKTSVKSVAFLTERGLFTVHFYSRIKETEVMDEISDRIIASIRFDDELRYRPRLTDYWPPGMPTILLLSGVLIAIIVLTIHLERRRRKQP
jgi:hypothetical protein